jgi:hypothetical protein
MNGNLAECCRSYPETTFLLLQDEGHTFDEAWGKVNPQPPPPLLKWNKSGATSLPPPPPNVSPWLDE